MRALAEAVGTSLSQVQRMFSSTATKCTLETLMKFSVITGVDLHRILKINKAS
ncbi:MAG: helix-turn-helix domain-containing protein [Pseudobdellovibrionaceae bacterium]|nr:helix-turn-helix domain-containing protein [Bdellovibrionales bacterium]USN48587.1 MAG: helix-turn-helix domain-containing protein [Pseudobdellovibrionaceae bacterium]